MATRESRKALGTRGAEAVTSPARELSKGKGYMHPFAGFSAVSTALRNMP